MTTKIPPPLMPKLRFPEFRGGPDFSVKTVGQLTTQVVAGGTPDTTEKRYWNGNIRWMNSGELNLKRVYEVEGRITEEGLRNSSTRVIPEHCILIGLAGQGRTRGTVAMNMLPLCTNQSIAAIFPNESAYDSNYIYHNLDSRYTELRNLSTGGEGRGGLNLQLIRAVTIPIPSLSEQRQIAECLGSLDDLIAAETRKLKSLHRHEQGVMQQLFPQPGETVPRLRFREFKEEPGWADTPVSNILTVRDQRCPPSADAPLFSLTIENGVCAKSDRYNREFLVADPGNKKYKLVIPKDIVYNPSNLRWGAINYSQLGHPVVVSPIYEVLYVTDTTAIDFAFIARALMRPEQIKRFIEKGQGTLIERIAVKIEFFLETSLPVPHAKAEQRRIADCLGSLDDQLTAQAARIEMLKRHKQALLQQLFPSLECVE